VSEALLAVQDVSKRYGSGPAAVHALTDITFEVSGGEAVAVTGPSGCGKSTLLNLLGLLDVPTEGRVIVGGIDASLLSPAQIAAVRNHHVGFVFQQFHLLATASVLDNVALPLLLRGEGLHRRRARAAAMLEAVELQGLDERRPSQLSGGQQQRVAIARALVTEPSVVLCDEPTGNLDRRTGWEVLELLLSVPSAQRAVVLITHDESVADAAQRRIELVDGRLIAQ
jgi:putative ABC transport system ATP-binding protein